MEKTFTYRDARLRSLPLRLMNGLGAGLGAMGLTIPSLEPQHIVDIAKHQTGLNDLGDEAVLTALAHYVDSAESEAQLNTLGRIAVQRMLVSALSSRLQLIDWVNRHPETNDETIVQPWIVVGLPRTGTSLLSILLGLDPMSRPLLQWEARRPIPPADLATAQEDPRIALFAQDVASAVRMNPPLAAMHPFGSTLAEECTAVFMYALRTIGMESIAFVPSYGNWLDDADMSPAYSIHKRLLQAFQNAQPTSRWVLKSPNHLWSLDALLATYPDARIIWTHRDPTALVTSLASLNCAMQTPFTRQLEPQRIGEYWANKISGGIDKASAYDDAADAGWCCHVQYHDLMSDPKGTLEKIYRHFGESPGELHLRRVDTWLRYRPQNAHGRHRYNPNDFGWTANSLQERYLRYRQRYRVPQDS